MKKEMQHKENELDNLFKDKLQDRTFEYQESDWADAEQLIADAEKSGKLKYRKRGGWLWFGGFITLLIGSIFFINLITNDKETQTENVLTQNDSASEINTFNKPDTSKNDNQKLIHSNEQSLNPEQDNLIGVNKIESENKNSLELNNSKNEYHKSKLSKLDLKNQNTTVQKEKTNSIQEIKIGIATKQETQIQENINIEILSESIKVDSENQQKNSTTTISNKNNLLESNPTNSNSKEIVLNENKVPISESETELKKDDGQKMNEINTSSISKQDSSIVENKPILLNPIDSKKLFWFVGVHGGLDYITKSLSTTSVAIDDAVNQRNLQENPIWTGGLGAFGGFEWKKWSLASGLNFFKLGEEINYPFTEYYQGYEDITEYFEATILDTIDIIYDTLFFDTTGIIDSIYTFYILDSVTYLDSSTITNIVSLDSISNLRETNLISYIEIPLLFGYQWNKGNWNFQIETGPSIGIYTFSSGYVLNLATPSSGVFEELQTTTFKKYSFNWIISPTVGYKLNTHFEIQCKPYLRFNVKSISEDANIQLKYQSYGAHIGMIYRF